MRIATQGTIVTNTLHIPLKGKWFNQIKSGEKLWEYRLFNKYWSKRLIEREYDHIHLTLGYPKKDDSERHLWMPYEGYDITTIYSDEWDNEPMRVFAIDVGGTKYNKPDRRQE